MTAPGRIGESGAAFHHPGFGRYWTAQLISLMGTFMQQVALGYLVYQLTGSVWLLGIVSALTLGPSLVLSLPAGVLADRMDRRKLILGTQSTALVLAFSLATLTALHRLQVWELLTISTISGIAIATESPARQAFLVELVGREDLPNAIAWNSLVISGARVLGPAVGGVAIRFVGEAPIFYYNSFSFLAMIVVLLSLRLHALPATRPRNPVIELREGLSYLRSRTGLLLILGLVAAVATFAMNFAVIMPIFARDVLHSGAEGLGWMWAAMGIGAVTGALTVVHWSGAAVGGRLLLVAACIAGGSEILMAQTRALPLTLGALVLAGWGSQTFFAGANAALQSRVTDALRGRVMSVYTMIFAGTGPVGGLITAGLASRGGAVLALAVGGLICVVVTLGAVPFLASRLSPPYTAEALEPQRAG